MADEVRNALAGLRTRLETISGLRVVDYPPEAHNEFPVAIFIYRGHEPLTMGGSSFEGKVDVMVLVGRPGDPEASADDLYNYLSATGTKSIEAAIDADKTWSSKVDVGVVDGVETVSHEEMWGGLFFAARIRCRFAVTVAA